MATPTITYNSSFPIERDDIELVKMFLAGFKDENGRTYKLKARPDVAERKKKAIEAIAESEDGRTLAIEHTYIQPFQGERADAVPFQTVFEQLRTDSDLSVPNRFIDVIVPAFAVEKGVNWKDVAQTVREWFLKVRESFPKEGEKWYTIPDVGFKLDVLVQTFDLPETLAGLRGGWMKTSLHCLTSRSSPRSGRFIQWNGNREGTPCSFGSGRAGRDRDFGFPTNDLPRKRHPKNRSV